MRDKWHKYTEMDPFFLLFLVSGVSNTKIFSLYVVVILVNINLARVCCDVVNNISFLLPTLDQLIQPCYCAMHVFE